MVPYLIMGDWHAIITITSDASPVGPGRHLPVRVGADAGAAAHLGLVLEGRLPLRRPGPLRAAAHLQVRR